MLGDEKRQTLFPRVLKKNASQSVERRVQPCGAALLTQYNPAAQVGNMGKAKAGVKRDQNTRPAAL